MVRTNLTVKCWPRTSRVLPWLMNRRQRQKVSKSFKIKLTLPKEKTVIIKNGEKVIKTIRVRRKTKYISDRNAINF